MLSYEANRNDKQSILKHLIKRRNFHYRSVSKTLCMELNPIVKNSHRNISCSKLPLTLAVKLNKIFDKSSIPQRLPGIPKLISMSCVILA